jgi:hypothetical protein
MQRRHFIAASTVGISALAAAASAAEVPPAGGDPAPMRQGGACGLSCAACRMKLNGKCPGCGQGKKAECAILQCATMKGHTYCAQCPGLPCDKLRQAGKLGEAWMEKLGQAPMPS